MKWLQTDARNNQMRDKIKVLREDIDVLRDQVARLERRVDFVKGKVQVYSKLFQWQCRKRVSYV